MWPFCVMTPQTTSSLRRSCWKLAAVPLVSLSLFLLLGLSKPISPHKAGRTKTWDIASKEHVKMHVEDTIHYQVNNHQHDAQWAQLWPERSHLVRIPNDPQPYTVGMFHQLGCLDLVHTAYLDRKASAPPQIIDHCLNYLRQSVLCESSTRLESVRKHVPPKVVEVTGEYRCRDWTRLYAGAAKQR